MTISSLPGFLNFLEPILYQPLLNILILFYYHIGDLGIAIILLTILIKLLLYPLVIKSIVARKKMTDIQPKIKEIKEKYKDNPQKQGTMMMQLFQKNKVNPLSGCLPLILQMPILLILFFLFKDIVGDIDLSPLYYNFIPIPQAISPYFFGLNSINLANPNIILTLVVGVSQFLQTKTMSPVKTKESKKQRIDMSPKELITDMMTKQMVYVLPIMIMVFALMLPSALALYWTFSSLFTAGAQYLHSKKIN